MAENLYEVWARRNPNFEKNLEQSLFREYTDYGVGATQYTEAKGKVLGAGYELYIIAFFIGLYAEKTRKLSDDVKDLGRAIQYWGNTESRGGRKAYPKLREYIFTALIAKCDALDLIVLEKGEITTRKAVDMLIDLMEQYANYGFYYLLDKLDKDPNIFYKHTGFLDTILGLVQPDRNKDDSIEEL